MAKRATNRGGIRRTYAFFLRTALRGTEYEYLISAVDNLDELLQQAPRDTMIELTLKSVKEFKPRGIIMVDFGTNTTGEEILEFMEQHHDWLDTAKHLFEKHNAKKKMFTFDEFESIVETYNETIIAA